MLQENQENKRIFPHEHFMKLEQRKKIILIKFYDAFLFWAFLWMRANWAEQEVKLRWKFQDIKRQVIRLFHKKMLTEKNKQSEEEKSCKLQFSK